MDRNFGGVIWTKHALSRMRKRGIKQGDAWATWRRPDQSRHSKIKGAWVYYKIYPAAGGASGNQKIEVVAKKNEQGKWVILSVWSRAVFDKKTKKAPSLWTLISEKLFGKRLKK